VFGLSFGELAVLIVVAIVVIGPKDLPKVLRKVGQWSGKLRRMAFDLRAQSGIDEVLNADGLGADLREIRKLARGELDGVVAAARVDFSAPKKDSPTLPAPADARAREHEPAVAPAFAALDVARGREFPREGADAYSALPDTAVVYVDALPASGLVDDAVFTCGFPTPAAPHGAQAAPHAAEPIEGMPVDVPPRNDPSPTPHTESQESLS
jgi:sec-independent protein translocase protein TatB